MAITLIGGGGGLDPEYVWLDAYKTYGEDSYAFNDKDIYDAMMRHKCAVNDKNVYNKAFSYVLSENSGVGQWFANAYGLTESEKSILSSLDTIESVEANTSAMNVISKNALLRAAIMSQNDTSLINHFLSNSTFFSYFCEDRTCIELMCKDSNKFSIINDNSTIARALCNSSLCKTWSKSVNNNINEVIGDAEKNVLIVATTQNPQYVKYYLSIYGSTNYFTPGDDGTYKMVVLYPATSQSSYSLISYPICKGTDGTYRTVEFKYIQLTSKFGR